MAYLGNSPARSFISFERQVFTIVNSQTVYTLDHSVTNENDIRLVVNNIVQEPGSGKAYTATGTTLTLSAALVNGTDEMYCVFLGRATATNAPGAGSVGTSQIADSSVSLAKLTATGTKDATTFLRGDNTFASAGLSGWSEDGANNNLLPASASAGIYLGVNSATAANLLDDYEEGTWTPVLRIDGGAGTQPTQNTQRGNYIKVGNQVTCVLEITASGTSLASGDLDISGLPFTSNSSPNARSSGSLRYIQRVDYNDFLLAGITHSTTNITLLQSTSSTTNVASALTAASADFSTGSGAGFNITITYFTD